MPLFTHDSFVLVKTTLLDFPGRVAAAIFLPGCHLCCPYCHNPELARPSPDNHFGTSVKQFQDFLALRAPRLGGVAISGGEPLLNPLLPELIHIIKNQGLAIKIDTAGLLPERLKTLLMNQSVDYVAMDLKTLPENYPQLGWEKNNAKEKLRQSLELLKSWGGDFELRTTVAPPLVDKTILEKLIPWTNDVSRWVWQVYHPGITLHPDWGNIEAPDESVLNTWAKELQVDVLIR